MIAMQAEQPNNPALVDGFYVAPTLFTGVTRDMRIAREEIFGPVATVFRFFSYEDAVAVANESEYGLVASVFTRDFGKGLRASRDLDVGIVFNNCFRKVLGTPFGGANHSGYRREHSSDSLKEFGRPKSVRFPSGTGKIPEWSGVADVLGPRGERL